MVTGGGGSIGAEICDRVVTFGAARLLVIENSEPALHAVLEVLATKRSRATIDGRIADVRDRERIFRLMADFRPDIVFHAAALKHVPLLERDWDEGVKTNVFGSVNVADAAAAAGATAMVMISTDKAIEPVSVLGATKRFAEMYCQALDADLRAAAQADSADAADRRAVRQCARLQRLGGPEVQGADRRRRPGDRHASRHGALFHDHSRSLRSGRDRGQPRARTGALGRLGLCAQHGPAGEDRRPRRADDPARRTRARVATSTSCSPASRPGERLQEILFAREEPTVEIGIAGVVAARPAQPSIEAMRGWLAMLEQGLAREERAAIYRVLREAVPDFRGEAA